MKPWFNQRPLLGIRAFVWVVLAIALLVLDQQSSYLRPVRSVVSVVVVPIQYLVDWPVRFVNWASNSLTSNQALVNENAHLRAQDLMLHSELQKLIALEQENQQLRALLKSTDQVSDKVIVAQLLAVDPDPFSHQVVLNKGSKQGVYVGQPLLDAYGIMGQVIQVGPITSRALLITDSHSGIPVEDSRNGYRGVAMGNGALSTLNLAHIPVTAGLSVGDTIVSSGLGQRYPIGYPVGVITKISHDTGEPFATIIVQPSAHLNQSRLVLLVWPQNKAQEITFGPLPIAEGSH